MSVRTIVAEELRQRGPSTIADLSAATGKGSNLVQGALLTMQRRGEAELVGHVKASGGCQGRRAQVWRCTTVTRA